MLPAKLLRFSDLKAVGINNWTSLKRRVKQDGFPSGRYIGSTRVWTEDEVAKWWDSRPTAPPENVKGANAVTSSASPRDLKAPLVTPGYKAESDSPQPRRNGG